MLRLLLDWACENAPSTHPFAVMPGARWYAEALLPAQFLARFRGDPLAEGWTNADGCIGHFHINEGKGELILDSRAAQFVVVEAKMGSGLSSGTTRAPGYDQAARNVVCMAEVLARADRHPDEMSRLAFIVATPRIQIERSVFGDLVSAVHIRDTVLQRVKGYEGNKDQWFEEWFLPTLDETELHVISWEDAVKGTAAGYDAFYQRCLRYNLRDGGE